ncbi:MAG: TIGR00730 family Rossman fold protein [Phycisphaerales bacterium]|nr:TIGR00730 family Rossman fold protein [Phycisphaerales bacterium]
MKAIAIFCGSTPGADPRFAQTATDVGRALARAGITVVYGGGRVGLMGIVADAALAEGGKVIGVIPRAMVEAERGHHGVTKLHVVTTMHERKALMADLSDGFVALPGGYGTLDELFEIITWAQLAFHAKPVALLNDGGFYQPLLNFLDSVVTAGFIQPRFRSMLMSSDSVDDLLPMLAAYHPPAGAGWARPIERTPDAPH